MTEQLSCDAISIPEWKLELMAKKIFEKVWGNQNKAILRACKMIESCHSGIEMASQLSCSVMLCSRTKERVGLTVRILHW